MTCDTLRCTPDINREYSINYERAIFLHDTPDSHALLFLYRGREMKCEKIINSRNHDPPGTRDISQITYERKSRTEEIR